MEIFKQRAEFSEIVPYRDYSKYPKIKNDPPDSETDGEFSLFSTKKQLEVGFIIPGKNNVKIKSNRGFYSDDDDHDMWISLYRYSNKTYGFITNKDRHIRNHFGRPFTQITLNTIERTISVVDNKIKIKISIYKRIRNVNCVFFRKVKFRAGININLDTGDFLVYNNFYAKKAQIYTNYFKFLYKTLNSEILNIERIIYSIHGYNNASYLQKQEMKSIMVNMDDFVFLMNLNEILSKKIGVSFSKYKNYIPDTHTIYSYITSFFVHKKQIKCPNEYSDYLTKWYPTKKWLKKNDNKLIAAILDKLDIKSKYTNKLLNIESDVDLIRLSSLIHLFGKTEYHKYIPLINTKVFKCNDINKHNDGGNQFLLNEQTTKYSQIKLTHQEKINTIKILNNIVFVYRNKESLENNLKNFMNDFLDHFRMLKFIRKHHPEIKYKSKSLDDFIQEHFEYSKIKRHLLRNEEITLHFKDEMIDLIETPIISDKCEYYPVILKNDDEYYCEGLIMKHCVAGYIYNKESIIVSLRKGSKE